MIARTFTVLHKHKKTRIPLICFVKCAKVLSISFPYFDDFAMATKIDGLNVSALNFNQRNPLAVIRTNCMQ